jgi:hypothetical protein
LIPIFDLIAIAAGVVALLLGYAAVAAACGLFVLGLIALRALMILRHQSRPGIGSAAEALAVAAVFDVAKALALLARGSHRARRSDSA